MTEEYLRSSAFVSGHDKEDLRSVSKCPGRKKRVLFLCEFFTPSLTACAKRIESLVEHLTEVAYEVHVLASDTSLLNAPENYVKPNYVHFYPAFDMAGKKTIARRLRNNLSEKSNSARIAKSLGEFDVVVCSTPPLMLAQSAIRIAKRTKAKLVLDVRDVWPDVAFELGSFSQKSIYARIFTRMANRAYENAELITTVTSGTVAQIKEKLPETSRQKVQLVMNGFDPTFLDQAIDSKVVKKYSLDEGMICAYVGNIGIAQGLSSLLLLARHFPHVRFLVFGDGAEEGELRKRADEECLTNVHFNGRIDSRSVYTVLKYASVAYVPLASSKLNSSVPTKMFEALGCGCPILLAAQGDAVSILNEVGLGVAVSPEGEDELVDALVRVLDVSYSSEIRKDSQKKVIGKYTRKRSAQYFERLLSAVCSDETYKK